MLQFTCLSVGSDGIKGRIKTRLLPSVGNSELCMLHNCSFFTRKCDVSALTHLPHPILQRSAGRVWTGTPLSHNLCYFSSLDVMENHLKLEMWFIFLKESPTDGGLTLRFQCCLCASNTMLNNSSVTISPCPILLKKALTLLRANCRARECISKRRNPERTWKAAKRCQQSIIVGE